VAALVALGLGFPNSANATIDFFSDRTAWEDAAGLVSFSENFSEFSADTPFRTSPLALNGTTIQQEGTERMEWNEVDVPPLQFTPNNGSNSGLLLTNFPEDGSSGIQVRITFTDPNRAFGFDSWSANDGEGVVLDVFSGQTLLGSRALTGGSGDFLGYVVTGGDASMTVRFRSNRLSPGMIGERFYIDNLAGTTVANGPPPPPPPPTTSFGAIRFTNASFSRGEGIGTASISVERVNGDDGAVGVSFNTTNGTALAGQDYTAASGALAWADGEGGPKGFNVPIANDAADEPNETVGLHLTSPTGGATLGSPSIATMTIVDDDGATTAGQVGFTSTGFTVGEAEPLATVSVSRTGGSEGGVAVEYDTSDGVAKAGQDYTAVGGSLNWASGDGADKVFQIPILDDIDFEGDEAFSVSLSQATGGATIGQAADAVVTINDNEGIPDCEDGDAQVCLLERFLVKIHFATSGGQSGDARAIKLTNSASSFEFFEVGNVEVVVKMKDGCGFPTGNPIRNFWVFIAGLTNVRVEVTIIDTRTGATRRFYNALSTPFFTAAADSPDGKQNPPGAIQATTVALGAFPTCDD
jgi:hypothetical protein